MCYVRIYQFQIVFDGSKQLIEYTHVWVFKISEHDFGSRIKKKNHFFLEKVSGTLKTFIG